MRTERHVRAGRRSKGEFICQRRYNAVIDEIRRPYCAQRNRLRTTGFLKRSRLVVAPDLTVRILLRRVCQSAVRPAKVSGVIECDQPTPFPGESTTLHGSSIAVCNGPGAVIRRRQFFACRQRRDHQLELRPVEKRRNLAKDLLDAGRNAKDQATEVRDVGGHFPALVTIGPGRERRSSCVKAGFVVLYRSQSKPVRVCSEARTTQ